LGASSLGAVEAKLDRLQDSARKTITRLMRG